MTKNFDVRSLPSTNEDPFADCDEEPIDTELADLISRTRLEDACSADELVDSEDVPICAEVADQD